MCLLRGLAVLFIAVIAVVQAATVSECTKEGSSRSTSLKLKKQILCNYDRENRPILDKKRPTNVSTYMVLKGIESDYGNIPTASIVFWMGFNWKDEFLTWKPEDYDGIDTVHISSKEIWVPDLQQYEEEKSESNVLADTDCLVTKRGLVTCMAEAYHTAKCDSDVTTWPYDTMTCVLKYTSGAYNISQMRLNLSAIRKNSYSESTTWRLIDTGSKRTVYSVNRNSYHEISFNFTLQRHNAMITATILVPALSLITMTLVPLLLQASKAERLCLVATNILTHLLFIQYMAFLAPTVGHVIPTTVSFFRDSLVISVLVLVELTLIKVLLSNKGPSPSWLITPCKFVSSGIFGRVLLTEEPQEIRDEENGTPSAQKPVTITKLIEEKNLIVTVCDKLCFVILFIVYFSMTIRMLLLRS